MTNNPNNPNSSTNRETPPSGPLEPVSLDRLFLARQPILDVNEVLIGYELLFRDSSDNRAANVAPGTGTAAVVCHAFTELGLASALGGHKGFVIADDAFLCHPGIEALPPANVVFEIDAALAGNSFLVARCLELSQRGYAFCLMNPLDLTEDVMPLLQQAMFLKLNIRQMSESAIRALLAAANVKGAIAIASHVETKEDQALALSLGFQFFQGYYFAEPAMIDGKRLDPEMQGLIRIINLLNHDADVSELERAFKGEPALTLKLLRLTNSAGIGLRVRINSVRQAINIIGRQHIQRWLQLLLYGKSGKSDGIERNPLMQLAALKGNFMERLARRCYPQQEEMRDSAFLIGLMSLMPAALGMPMNQILEQLAIAPPLRQALLQREGQLGLLLELTDAYDEDAPARADRALTALGHRISRETLNQSLAESIAWVQSLGVEAS